MANKAKKSQSLETADYTVLHQLEHDGDAYAVGETVALTAEQAEPLLAVKAVVAAAAAAPAAE